MTALKRIYKLVHLGPKKWIGDGFQVGNAIDYHSLGKYLNPFIWLDYAPPHEFGPNQQDTAKGIGMHPHRGIDTVSIMIQGELTHRDGCGNEGTIKQGDAQWMRAGRGIEHSERHSAAFSSTGGVFEMIQLWVNLPAKEKLTTPGYQDILQEKIPKYKLKDAMVDVIAGKFDNAVGPGDTKSPMSIYNVDLNGETKFSVPQGWVAAAFVHSGSATINGQTAEYTDLVALTREGTDIEIVSNKPAKVLVLAGEPLDEPIVGRGPVVMNNKQQVDDAFKDYRRGLFRQEMEASAY